jgi:hypothetical protein
MEKAGDKKDSKKLVLENDERVKLFSEALKQENDRAVAIISACLIDNLLEGLLRAFYVKDTNVKTIFKNDQILQSLFAKINIAYFSGLIPLVIYHDLKIICEIRNKFAHEVTTNLDFENPLISQRIGKCILRPKTIDDISINRLKYIIIVEQLISYLCLFEHLILQYTPPSLVESLRLNNFDWTEVTLTREEIFSSLRNGMLLK